VFKFLLKMMENIKYTSLSKYFNNGQFLGFLHEHTRAPFLCIIRDHALSYTENHIPMNLRKKQYQDCVTHDVGVPAQTVVEYIMKELKMWRSEDENDQKGKII